MQLVEATKGLEFLCEKASTQCTLSTLSLVEFDSMKV